MTAIDSKAGGGCAAKLKLLADHTRLRVMQELLAGPRQVRELNLVLKQEQSLLSHHLQVLRAAGLVESFRRGKGVVYRLAPALATTAGATLNLGCCALDFGVMEPKPERLLLASKSNLLRN